MINEIMKFVIIELMKQDCEPRVIADQLDIGLTSVIVLFIKDLLLEVVLTNHRFVLSDCMLILLKTCS